MKAVIFDLDGLLIDSEPFWREALGTAMEAVNVHPTPDDYVQVQGMRIDLLIEHWQQRFLWETPTPAEVTQQVLQHLIDLVDKQGKPKAGAAHILNFFQEREIPIGLASSSPMYVIEAALKSLGIASYFDVVVSAESEQYGKPHPGVYLSTAEKLGVAPQHCLVFEDSGTGVLAAKAAGMFCVCVPDPPTAGDKRLCIADRTIPSLASFDAAMWAQLTG
jgi:sugar-phosphatase